MRNQEKSLFDLAEKSFFSVMIYGYQNEENKASRMLGAIAFITAAAASVFAKIYVSDKAQPTLLIFGINWVIISFSLYMLFVLFGALCCLAVLDPALNLPESFKNAEESKKTSYLFFKLIAEGGLNNWLSSWEDKTISNKFIENYKFETFLLAQVALIKHKIIRAGGIFFRLAILFLLYLVSALFMPELDYIKIFILVSTFFFLAYLIIERAYLRASPHVNKAVYYVAAIFLFLLMYWLSSHLTIV